jgi:ATP-dependent DNA ligase
MPRIGSSRKTMAASDPSSILYLFDLLALRGKDSTQEPLERRRNLFANATRVMLPLPDSFRYSETLEASSAELIEAVREQGPEGIVA